VATVGRSDLAAQVLLLVVRAEGEVCMPRTSQHLSVLLLSSNEEATGQLRETLAREVELAAAWTGEELFHLLETAQYDAFLCDWESLGGRCREVCREVKQLYPGLPIIVVSRCGGEQEWVEVLEAGCFDLIAAPYSVRQVLSVVEYAVASREDRVLLQSVA